MDSERFLRRVDRLAGGSKSSLRIDPAAREHPRTRRAFTAVYWLLAIELLLGIGAVVIALILAGSGEHVALSVWSRSLVVLAMTATLFYFAWRARLGYVWGYSRLRLFSKIFPVVTLVMAAIPGFYPLWMVTEQIVFSLILIGVADFLDSDHMRDTYRHPGPAAAPEV
ncbi:hypothetical protein [Mycetocola spongiae]|uniref:hypothetical protein n=1 Tax=Mycetocola spongiae TaxID=2859226 RepID=UPI001CF1453E|nr:hypothetical protein [Mycetocola spongiae]UCR87999.1 hypothetical protein KXZ72_08240 [Mycetocola spongiae]